VAGATDKDGDEHPTQRWDQRINNATTRFVVLSAFGGAAVRDNETGLVWEQSPDPGSPSGTPDLTWSDAQFHCNGITTGGRLGWRLPTLQELASLVDATVKSAPFLTAGHPFSNVQSSLYWSATTNATFTSNAWGVRFDFGQVFYGPDSDKRFAWCVRGGQGVNAQ
jgi:hypothetical protein